MRKVNYFSTDIFIFHTQTKMKIAMIKPSDSQALSVSKMAANCFRTVNGKRYTYISLVDDIPTMSISKHFDVVTYFSNHRMLYPQTTNFRRPFASSPGRCENQFFHQRTYCKLLIRYACQVRWRVVFSVLIWCHFYVSWSVWKKSKVEQILNTLIRAFLMSRVEHKVLVNVTKFWNII